MTDAATGGWLVWMWQHYALELSQHETIEDAVRFAEAVQEAGDGSLECIEGPTGVLSAEDHEAALRAMRERDLDAIAERPAYTNFITITSPDGTSSAQWDWYTSPEHAEAELARLLPRFGDRVSLRDAP
jgi:hypothetical protein